MPPESVTHLVATTCASSRPRNLKISGSAAAIAVPVADTRDSVFCEPDLSISGCRSRIFEGSQSRCVVAFIWLAFMELSTNEIKDNLK